MMDPLLTLGAETLDPETWPMWLKLMAGWGPLGVIAGISIYYWTKAERAHHQTRDRHEKHVEASAQDFAQKLADKDAGHRAETLELTDRFVTLIETQAEAQRSYAEAVKRKKGGRRDDQEGGSAASGTGT